MYEELFYNQKTLNLYLTGGASKRFRFCYGLYLYLNKDSLGNTYFIKHCDWLLANYTLLYKIYCDYQVIRKYKLSPGFERDQLICVPEYNNNVAILSRDQMINLCTKINRVISLNIESLSNEYIQNTDIMLSLINMALYS